MRIGFNTRKLPKITIKVNGNIGESRDLYRKYHIPMPLFLTNYLAVKTKDLLARAENPWEFLTKKEEGRIVERGVSVDETAFRYGSMKLKDELPSDVINAAFYDNKTRDDSDFEIGYLLPGFIQTISKDDNVLIVNPSPNMICFFEKATCPCRKRIYSVPDDTVAKLYKLQFPKSSFITFEELESINDVGAVLLVNRNLDISYCATLLNCLSGCNENAKVLGLIPSMWFDSAKTDAPSMLDKFGFVIRQALIVDPAATVSTPRKKILVVMEKGEQATMEIIRSNYDADSRLFTILEKKAQIDEALYLKTNKTLLSLWKETTTAPDDVSEPRYNKAEEYRFSEEISLFYKIYSERKKKYAGVANYRAIKSIEPKTWGKKLIKPDIEKGLRADTEEDVIKAISNLVFDDKVYPVIRSDIEKNYLSTRPLTLKTVWFYCWSVIADSPKYDHEFMCRLFTLPDAANVIPQAHSGEKIIEAISNSLSIEPENIPFKYVEQVHSLLNAALKLKLIPFNPMDSYLAEYSRRATERQQDVRNALVKKHFSSKEELTIFSSIIGKQSPRKILCTEKSILLATAIRLFTGMAIREVAALNWSDFRPIDNTNDYQFLITKFVDQNGTVMLHSEKQNWKRFRIVPSAKILTILLLARKAYLIGSGVDEEYLQDCPIILGEERISDMKNKKKISHCKPMIISKSGNALIKQADIPENIIVLPDAKNDLASDFNRYHGDIFQTNFRDKANHSAFMTNGEINYILGVDAPDTFSRYYCDYSNDYIQLGIIQKMCRWELSYEHMVTIHTFSAPAYGEQKGNTLIEAGPYKNGVASVDLLIRNNSSSDTDVTIKSFHGLKVNTTVYEDNNGKDTYQ